MKDLYVYHLGAPDQVLCLESQEVSGRFWDEILSRNDLHAPQTAINGKRLNIPQKVIEWRWCYHRQSQGGKLILGLGYKSLGQDADAIHRGIGFILPGKDGKGEEALVEDTFLSGRGLPAHRPLLVYVAGSPSVMPEGQHRVQSAVEGLTAMEVFAMQFAWLFLKEEFKSDLR